MNRTKIDYGIDLGTTNSAITRMENGEPVIKKTDLQKDTLPSCVNINKKQIIRVGDTAYNTLKRDKLTLMSDLNHQTNTFIEFKRTMGTDETYPSSYLDRDLSAEELSAEVLKTLKSFVKDEVMKSVVITVPAAFKNNQKEATREAAKMAGFEQIELLQEPVAASMAYGIEASNKEGFWLVFDFGGGTFDAALLKVEEGIMKVIDTEGNNYLGGKNLDLAIVDEIIIPYLEENYAIDSFLEDEDKKQALRNAMKFFAEETKIALSYADTHNLLTDLGDIPGEDDEGEEFELDLIVKQADIERALSPIFQEAIDTISILLGRNNLSGEMLDSLILVGGPTLSPVLRNMLAEQVCTPDTSVDPMTVVSRGAALYASTINVSNEIVEASRDVSKIQLEITHEASTVEPEEFVSIKILADKTEGELPGKILCEITRGDKGWSSGKSALTTIGDVFEVQLEAGKTNAFTVELYDAAGDRLDCQPNSFNLIQGSKIGSATLAYNFGIEIKDRSSGMAVFRTIKGLEKNSSIPAVGVSDTLKTQKAIRPGMADDVLKIPLYEGESEAEGTRAIYNEHVNDIVVSGADLPALLPEYSDVELAINLDRSEEITVSVYFPLLDYTHEVKAVRVKSQVDSSWLDEEIEKAQTKLEEMTQNSSVQPVQLRALEEEIEQVEENLNKNREDADNKQQTLGSLRKTLKKIDEVEKSSEWPALEQALNEGFERLKNANDEFGNSDTTIAMKQMQSQLLQVVASKDMRAGKALLSEVESLFFQLTIEYQLVGFITYHHENFYEYNWLDRQRARQVLDTGLQLIQREAEADALRPIIGELISLLPEGEKNNSNNSLLLG